MIPSPLPSDQHAPHGPVSRFSAGILLVTLVLLAGPQVWAAQSGQLTEADRVAILRDLIARVGTARVVFPQGKKGLELTAGADVANAGQADQQALNLGAAARQGERVAITAIKFESKRILFDINGGPRREKWYNHIELGMGGMMTPVGNSQAMAQGSEIVLKFPSGIPHLTPQQVRTYLNPAIDWEPHPIARVMVKKLPPPVKKAITQHEVLVGMDTSMVVAARGRTNVKYREQDPKTGDEYEEWVYGQPPEALFVKIEGDRVVETIAYHRDGTRVVQNQPQIQPPPRSNAPAGDANRPSLARTGASGQAAQEQDQRPTLRRPGEAAPGDSRTVGGNTPVFLPSQGSPMPGDPGAPSGVPGQMPGQMPGDGQLPPR
jgi:hypothetical protein